MRAKLEVGECHIDLDAGDDMHHESYREESRKHLGLVPPVFGLFEVKMTNGTARQNLNGYVQIGSLHGFT